jgi:hypothetical protein
MGYGLACGDINFYQGKVLGKVLECLEELSMEISKVNNEKFPLS